MAFQVFIVILGLTGKTKYYGNEDLRLSVLECVYWFGMTKHKIIDFKCLQAQQNVL